MVDFLVSLVSFLMYFWALLTPHEAESRCSRTEQRQTFKTKHSLKTPNALVTSSGTRKKEKRQTISPLAQCEQGRCCALSHEREPEGK
ncbi:hypothetical protein F5883DRAFT_221665 [Diaporthe sp. PMI_573]|nr:hypothetical protein F5883DRAFT_221665 [Diaporthaceae sp. PMI_573]